MTTALAASPVSHAVRPQQGCSRAFAAAPAPLRPCSKHSSRNEAVQRPQEAAQLPRCRRSAHVCAASAAAVPTAAPGATKIGFLGIGIMGNAMVGGAASAPLCWGLPFHAASPCRLVPCMPA